MLWPSFLSAESGWAAMKPIGTHGSVVDPRLVFPFLSVLTILAVGVRALQLAGHQGQEPVAACL